MAWLAFRRCGRPVERDYYNGMGAWDMDTEYARFDVVGSGTMAYYCVVNNTNVEPPNESYWREFADLSRDGELVISIDAIGGFPLDVVGGEQRAVVSDKDARDILQVILRELKKLNVQMGLVTDAEIEDERSELDVY